MLQKLSKPKSLNKSIFLQNSNVNFFLLNLQVSKYFNDLLSKKNILLNDCNINLNSNQLNLNLVLFFRKKKLLRFRKHKIKLVKKKKTFKSNCVPNISKISTKINILKSKVLNNRKTFNWLKDKKNWLDILNSNFYLKSVKE